MLVPKGRAPNHRPDRDLHNSCRVGRGWPHPGWPVLARRPRPRPPRDLQAAVVHRRTRTPLQMPNACEPTAWRTSPIHRAMEASLFRAAGVPTHPTLPSSTRLPRLRALASERRTTFSRPGWTVGPGRRLEIRQVHACARGFELPGSRPRRSMELGGQREYRPQHPAVSDRHEGVPEDRTPSGMTVLFVSPSLFAETLRRPQFHAAIRNCRAALDLLGGT